MRPHSNNNFNFIVTFYYLFLFYGILTYFFFQKKIDFLNEKSISFILFMSLYNVIEYKNAKIVEQPDKLSIDNM